MTFIPRDMVPVAIGKHTANLYPKVDTKMGIAERAYAFHVTSQALASVHVAPRVMLDVLGSQLNCSSTIDGIKADWSRHFDDHWIDPACLTILSFHNSAGILMNNATTVADNLILKPVQNGAVVDCRPPDVKYVRLQLDLDFADLKKVEGSVMLRTHYYVELPQTAVIVQNAAAADRQLVTWHGASDLRTLTVDQMRDDILDQTAYDMPLDLTASAFNVTNATVDDTVLITSLEDKIVRLAKPSIMYVIFDELCPSYTKKPHAAVEGVTQTIEDAEGNVITQDVNGFYQRFTRACRPFWSDRTFDVDVCRKFLDGLDPLVSSALQEKYDKYHDRVPLDGRTQRDTLRALLKHCTSAEQSVRTTTMIMEVNTGQSFHSASVNSSQAEKTLSHYQRNGGDRNNTAPEGVKCHGCGGNHFYQRGGVKLCPDWQKPEVQKAAKAAYDKKREKRVKKSDKGKRWSTKEPDLDDLTEAGRKKISRQVYAAKGSSVTSSITGNDPEAGAYGTGPLIMLLKAMVLQSTSSRKKPLPVPINSLIPHINLQLGLSLEGNRCPVIGCVIDTAASLNTGNFAFVKKVAALYPNAVARVYTDKSYEPISLSGIVQIDGKAVSTLLPVAFVFHTPYVTKDGTPTTIIIACGPQVTVNVILGIPFIESTKMIIDMNDKVADLQALDAPPFRIDSRMPQCAAPQVERSRTTVNYARYGTFLQELDALEAHVGTVYATTTAPASRDVAHLSSDQPPATDAMVPYVPPKPSVRFKIDNPGSHLGSSVSNLPRIENQFDTNFAESDGYGAWK